MKRFLLLSIFLMSLVSSYGQGGIFNRFKKVERTPVEATGERSSSKVIDAQEIDGSKNEQTPQAGQTKSTVQPDNTFIAPSGQTLMNRVRITRDSLKTVERAQSVEPQSVYIERERSQMRTASVGSHEETTFSFFRETPQLHIPRPEKQIRIHYIETDQLGITNVKGIQVYRNIPVYGMDFTLNISAQSERFMGCTVDTMHIDVNGVQLSAADAIRIAEKDLGVTTEIRAPSEFMRSTMGYSQPTAEAIYYPVRLKTYRYCYKVVIRPNIRDEWIYYIDAKNGEIVDKYNNTPSDGPNKGTGADLHGVSRTVDTYLENGTHYMVNTTKPMFNRNDFSGFIAVYDVKGDKGVHEGKSFNFATSTSANWNNPASISAMHYTSLVYDYLQNTFTRKSFDDKGASMMAFVNMPDKNGRGYDNAFWNGSIIALGNGDTDFYNLAGSLDVIAHEFGHAVVSHTAKLEYKNQSGAINEMYADIFGAMVDRANWTIGEAVIKDKKSYPTGALRDMSNPHNGGSSINDDCWQPAHVSEMYLGTGDNGGVHINSGIPNFAYYTYATATSKEKAEQVFYRALKNYLRPTSKFIDLRKSVIEAAKDLYGPNTNDVQLLAGAFDKVGVIDDTVVDIPPPDLPTNPGDWGLLLCNTNFYSDPNSLYKIINNYQTFTPISKTPWYSKPTVTDDGKLMFFCDEDFNIRSVDLNSLKETVIFDDEENTSVAISRDGKRLAVVTTYERGHIWLYDFATKKQMTFLLYNPTTGSGGAQSAGPRYADAIEFDHTGEYIIYDAYNVVGSSMGGNEVEYWDIGLINVWDNSKNSWGTGEVSKLFSDLTPGVNIMNPVFSKNSPHIIAFDYYEEEEDFCITFGLNLSTGDLGVLLINNIPSFPSYSMDDKRLAFTTADLDWWGNIEFSVGYIDLDSDKISSIDEFPFAEDATIIASDAAYPVYYGTGTRVLGTKPVAAFTADARSGSNPLNVQFLDMSEGNPSSWSWTFQGGIPSTSTRQHPQVNYTKAGTYPVKLVVTNSFGSDQIVREGFITVSGSAITGTSELFAPNLKVHPNPFSDAVRITDAVEAGADSNAPVQLRVMNAAGTVVHIQQITSPDETIHLGNLPAGAYFFTIENNKQAKTVKIIKN